MARKSFSQNALSFLHRHLRRPENPTSTQWKIINAHASQLKYEKYTSLIHRAEELSNQTLIFHSEASLLKSSSLFPYFMLVAFEAGGLLRALIFFLLYPLVCLFGEELGLKIQIFLCFFGIKKESFRLGTAVLPRFFLQDVGDEGFEVVKICGRKVAVSDLPRIMVEGFLKDYLGVDAVLGKELKVVCGYYVGLVEDIKADGNVLDEILGEKRTGSVAIGFCSYKKLLDQHLLAHCKEVCLVSEAEKRNWQILPREKYQNWQILPREKYQNWQNLPREKYPKPLIFHDGRLALRPTQLATLAMFMWIPLGIFLVLIRVPVGITLPHWMANPILAFSGTRTTVARSKSSIASTNNEKRPNGIFYVCNHRTLLDPLYVQSVLDKPLSTVTYSISKFTALIAPIRTIHLTRDREKDGMAMKKLLSYGDVVVCTEGTTCREPYLLRFSPLFAELAYDIVPVAIDVQVSMFYGTTAGGCKCLDYAFHFLNPYPTYCIKFLEKLPDSHTCKFGGVSKFEVANHVQHEIAKAFGFQCTSLTRKDKYMILAGNEGIIRDSKRP